MSSHNSDGEVDSLFGSPPPSPGPELGRGGSQVLALPGSPSATYALLPKNVGTIALPGSHNHSELVVSLPVSSPEPQTAQPTQPLQRQYRFAEWIGPTATSQPSDDAGRVKPRKKKRKAKSVTPGHDASKLNLSHSETDKPFPRNFLRNQQALLGLAGLVGGVNPAHLSPHGSRGSTAENPIIVEETPSHSASSWRSDRTQNAPLPSSQTIADTLVSQGNIFPILRSLMPYFGMNDYVGCCSNNTLQQYRMQDSDRPSSNIPAPPLKRRKLHTVPAGAKDWDVPYPFPPNEGPPGYFESWQKKRGKKLMIELVSLVRDAVQKAAAKSPVHEDASKSERAVEAPDDPLRLYESSAMSYGMDNGSRFTPESSITPVSSTTASSDQQALLPDFSDLFPLFHDGTGASTNFAADFDSLLGAVNDTLSDPNVQLSGNDLAAMSSFNFSSTSASSPSSTSSAQLPTPCDLGWPSAGENKENDMFPQLQVFNFDDTPIDPTLDVSWSSPPVSHSVLGTEARNNVIQPTDTSDVPLAQGMAPNVASGNDPLNMVSFDPASHELPCLPLGNATEPESQGHPSPVLAVAATSQNSEASPPSTAPEASSSERPVLTQFRLPSSDESSYSSRSADKPAVKKVDREDVLRRARIRREQLAAEIARAKIELWETTIEQGVLTHISKDKELLPKE